MDAALAFYAQLRSFCSTMSRYFLGKLLPMQAAAAPNEVTMAEAQQATPVAPTPPPPAAPVSAPLSPGAAAFQARVHELFAQNVALGQERNAAAVAALQQAQAEQGSLASSPGTASSKDVEMA